MQVMDKQLTDDSDSLAIFFGMQSIFRISVYIFKDKSMNMNILYEHCYDVSFSNVFTNSMIFADFWKNSLTFCKEAQEKIMPTTNFENSYWNVPRSGYHECCCGMCPDGCVAARTEEQRRPTSLRLGLLEEKGLLGGHPGLSTVSTYVFLTPS